MNKILEKVVHNQLVDFLIGNNIIDIFQSGFSTKHSTELALLKVTNNILLSIDSAKSVALMMLDLSAAFRYFGSCDFNRTPQRLCWD